MPPLNVHFPSGASPGCSITSTSIVTTISFFETGETALDLSMIKTTKRKEKANKIMSKVITMNSSLFMMKK